MQLSVANHITNNGGTEYHKTCILYEYPKQTGLVDFNWAGIIDLEVFQTEKILRLVPRYSNNTNFVINHI